MPNEKWQDDYVLLRSMSEKCFIFVFFKGFLKFCFRGWEKTSKLFSGYL